jgi:hypothetical protein
VSDTHLYFIYHLGITTLDSVYPLGVKLQIMETKQSPRDPYVFETRDMVRFTGIPPNYLNKFIERRSFGIKPSIRKGSGRGTRRLFSDEDAYGIALVWALFQAGLRSKVIGQVLKAMRALDTPQGLATGAAVTIMQDFHAHPDLAGPHVLVIRRSLVRSKAKDLQVLLEGSDYATRNLGLSGELVIPVDAVFEEVAKKIQRFRPERRS